MLVPFVYELNGMAGGVVWLGFFLLLGLECILLFKMACHSALVAESLEIHIC